MSLSPPYPSIIVKNGRFPIMSGFTLPRSTVFITAGPRNCLYLFRMHEWMPIREKLLEAPMPEDPPIPEAYTYLARLLIGYGLDVRISGRGMIGLDEALIKYAGIQGRLLWVPGHKVIELWRPDIFDESKRINLFDPENNMTIKRR